MCVRENVEVKKSIEVKKERETHTRKQISGILLFYIILL